MSQHIDIAKNIRETLVLKKEEVNSSMKLETLLKESGLKTYEVDKVFARMEAHSLIPTLEIQGNCLAFTMAPLPGVTLSGKGCITGKVSAKLEFLGLDIVTLNGNMKGNGICADGENYWLGKAEICFKLRGNCVVLTIDIDSKVVGNLHLEEELFCF